MADSQRSATAGDMIRSIAVILGPVIVLMILLTQTPKEPALPQVDWRPVLTDARAKSPWPVLAPKDLPEGPQQWRVTRVHWSAPGEAGPLGGKQTRHQWMLGLISPDTIHYAVNQADGDIDPFVAETTRDGKPVGEETIGGQRWEHLETADGRTRALVRRGPTDVVTVVADTDFGHLSQFTRTLTAD